MSISNTSERLMQLAIYAAISVASFLIVIKLIAYGFTHSVAILSSLVDSLFDLLASSVNFFAVRHALSPADHEHRYGHGKAEAIAGLAQAAFISVSTIFLVLVAAGRLVEAKPIEHGFIGIWVMAISILLTAGLVKLQSFVAKKTGSLAITADSLHYVGDLLMNLSVVLALLCSFYLNWHTADPLFALFVAAYLFHGAWQVARQSVAQLMDQELPDSIRKQIRDIALDHSRVINIHELRTRASGRQYFIQLHLEMDGSLTLLQAHQIAEEVERKILQFFPNAEVIIHEDPEGITAGEIR